MTIIDENRLKKLGVLLNISTIMALKGLIMLNIFFQYEIQDMILFLICQNKKLRKYLYAVQ